jgi:hypothetical protein
MAPAYRACYEWLAANGIDELLPDRPLIIIDHPAQRLSVTCWVWGPGADRWGRDLTVTRLGDGLATEERTVPLTQPLTDRIRAALTRCGARLVEHP